MPPLVPLMVSVRVPREVFRLVVILSVDDDVAGFGLKVAVVLFGRPCTLSATAPPKPLTAPIVTV